MLNYRLKLRTIQLLLKIIANNIFLIFIIYILRVFLYSNIIFTLSTYYFLKILVNNIIVNKYQEFISMKPLVNPILVNPEIQLFNQKNMDISLNTSLVKIKCHFENASLISKWVTLVSYFYPIRSKVEQSRDPMGK